MTRIRQGVFGLLLLLASQANAISRNNFAYEAEIGVDAAATWYQLQLPIDVAFKSQSLGFGDVRVINADGEALPYSVVRNSTRTINETKSNALALFPLRVARDEPATLPSVHVRSDNGVTSIDVVPLSSDSAQATLLRGWLLDARHVEGVFTVLHLDWSVEANGFSQVDVEGSDDLLNWHRLAQGQLGQINYTGEVVAQKDLKLNSWSGKYLRVLWAEKNGAPELIAAHIDAVNTSVENARMTWSKNIRPTRVDDKAFYYVLPSRVRIEQIRFADVTENTLAPVEVFGRAITTQTWSRLGAANIYRLKTDSTEILNDDVYINASVVQELKLQFDRRGTGISVPTISLGAIASQLLFLGRGATPYTLVVGNGSLSSEELAVDVLIPDYATNNGAAVTGSHIRNVSVGEFVATGQVPPADAKKDTTVTSRRGWLWVILVAGVVLLAAMSIHTLRTSNRSNRGA